MPYKLTTAQQVATAEQILSKADKVMAALISAHGSCQLLSNNTDPLIALIRIIIGQQLSGKAATTIASRFFSLYSEPFGPNAVLSVSDKGIRAAGISSSKIHYIKTICREYLNKRLNFNKFESLDNDQVIDQMIQLPGIGKWSAEMFLIFGLRRLDVLSMADAGLRRSFAMLYGNKSDLLAFSPRWAPYRSVASWYLWRHLDN